MRIAVVTSAPLFVEGGHLVIARSLVQALREQGHEAAVVLTPQNRFGRQGAAYLATWLTDVGLGDHDKAVDQVISLRYPSYAVRHPNHVVWLNHTMREYYDQWETFSRSLSWKGRIKEGARRRLIHTADRYLLTRNVRRVFTQSRTISARLQRWGGIPSEPLYPPPPQRAYRCESYGDYFFAVSRLAPLKRLSLLIEALALPEAAGMRCVIAGEGEEQRSLEQAIASKGLTPRVTLAGRIDDDQMLEHLANCRAVCFPAYDEDYGFVTVEAFASAKPVITCVDSGGPAELVSDNVTGKVCAPRADALAAAMRELMNDRVSAERMGKAGLDTVSEMTWERAVQAAAGSMTAKPGIIMSALVGAMLLAFAVSVDFPKANGDRFKGDESTYYMLGHSLARDLDFQYERKDLIRVWEEFSGPEGVFLKTGKDVEIRSSSSFPFFRWLKREDPERETRLYFSKSYIYPLAAAPFVALFGTDGFLVLHALLIAFDLLVIYLFILAATKSNVVALPMSIAFLATSVVPVYFVWLMPELFNFSLVLYAVFLWAYKEVGAGPPTVTTGRLLTGPKSDYLAALFVALATFSKPSHLLVLAPMVLLALRRRHWTRAGAMLLICGGITAALVAANAAITGEFNYQGGDRKTFYSYTGFPFANSWETFDNIGPVRGREDLMVGDVLVNTHSGVVLLHNLWYFLSGRNAGLLPYFFPGVLALVLFLFTRQKHAWQWLTAGTIAAAVLAHVFVWPFTWNGGGGPVGSRYFLPFYALFLVLIPATAGLGAVAASFVGGALFTAQLVLNPFYVSLAPGVHTNSGPLRWLPTELTLLHDLPVAQDRDRMRRQVGPPDPGPHALAYFIDDNSFVPEETPKDSRDYWFWVKGNAKAEIVLRAPIVSLGDNNWQTKALTRIALDVRNGGAPNLVTVATDSESQSFQLTPGESRTVSLRVPDGVPFRREVQPTSYLYNMSVATTAGFVPFLEVPCEAPGKCPSSDPRFLGAMIHIIPEYTDAEITRGWVPPGGAAIPRKEDASGVLDTP